MLGTQFYEKKISIRYPLGSTADCSGLGEVIGGTEKDAGKETAPSFM